MDPPQTLRLKPELSLDVPSNYSTVSPCPEFTLQKSFEASAPLLPTFLETWNFDITPNELGSLPKGTYGEIREKEKELKIIAESGKSLLEYDVELAKLQHLQRARLTTYQIGDKNATPIIPPNDSRETFVFEPELEESDTESLQGWSGSSDLQSPITPGETPFRRKNRDQEAYTMATRKIEDLKKENETLLHKVHELKEQNNLVEIAKLQVEQQIAHTTSELEAMKEEYVYFEERLKNYETLLIDNLEKENLIADLSKSLEEQRALVENYQSSIRLQEPPVTNFISETQKFGLEVFETSFEGFRHIFETSLEGFRKQLGI